EPVSPPASAGNGSSAGAEVSERPMAKPPVRKLAKDLGVDLAELTGSGPEGTITREDVQAAAGGLPVASAPPAQPSLAATAWLGCNGGRGRTDPDQGGTEAHGGRGNCQCVYRAARDRVPADRHDRDDERGAAAAGTTGVRRVAAQSAAAGGQGADGRRGEAS